MRHTVIPADREFDIVAYGKTSKLPLQKGVKILEIVLAVEGILPSQLLDTIITLDGDAKYSIQFSSILDIEKYLKLDVNGNAEFFAIPFADFSAKSTEGQTQSGLQILNENAVLKVSIGPKVQDQIDASTVPTMYAIINYGVQNLTAEGVLFRKATPMLKNDTITISKTGENNFFGYEAASPNGLNMLERAYFYGANITELHVKVKSARNSLYVEKQKLTKSAIEYWQKRSGRAPIDNCVVFDPLMFGFNRADLLNPELGIQFVVKTSNGTNVEVVWQSLEITA
jgi:hypothetical protein